MRSRQIEEWTERHEPRGINVLMRHVVMPLDVIEVNGIRNSGPLVEITEITMQMRIVDDATQVAFEMPDVHRVEAHERAEQPPIRFDGTRAEKITPCRESALDCIKRREKSTAGAFVSGLHGGEPSTINAVVDIFVDELGELGVL